MWWKLWAVWQVISIIVLGLLMLAGAATLFLSVIVDIGMLSTLLFIAAIFVFILLVVGAVSLLFVE